MSKLLIGSRLPSVKKPVMSESNILCELRKLREVLAQKEQNRKEIEAKKNEHREQMLKEIRLKNKLMEKYLESFSNNNSSLH